MLELELDAIDALGIAESSDPSFAVFMPSDPGPRSNSITWSRVPPRKRSLSAIAARIGSMDLSVYQR